MMPDEELNAAAEATAREDATDAARDARRRAPHAFAAKKSPDESYSYCAICGIGPGAYVHSGHYIRTDPDLLGGQLAPDTKPSNPKDALGVAKVPFSVLSMQVIGEMAVGMFEGARKYGRHNYRIVGVRASIYFDSIFRHASDWYEGQDIDPGSGLNHVVKIMTSCHVLLDSMLQGNWVDDRPPRAKNQAWIEDLNKRVEALIAKYPNPVEAWTQVRVLAEAAEKEVMTPIQPTVVESSFPASTGMRWLGVEVRPKNDIQICKRCGISYPLDASDTPGNATFYYCSSKCAALGNYKGINKP